MSSNTEWLKVLSEVPTELDITRLKSDIFKFIRLIDYPGKTPKTGLFKAVEARSSLDSAFSTLKHLIEPEPKKNEYVKPWHEDYKNMMLNIGRWNKRVDETEKAVLQKIDETYPTGRKGGSLYLKQYKEQLKEGEQVLLFNPLLRATQKFHLKLVKDGKPIVKDSDLFGYFLFFELLMGTELLGTLSREEGRKGESFFSSSGRVPPFPKTAKVGDISEDSTLDNADIESFLSDSEVEVSIDELESS